MNPSIAEFPAPPSQQQVLHSPADVSKQSEYAFSPVFEPGTSTVPFRSRAIFSSWSHVSGAVRFSAANTSLVTIRKPRPAQRQKRARQAESETRAGQAKHVYKSHASTYMNTGTCINTPRSAVLFGQVFLPACPPLGAAVHELRAKGQTLWPLVCWNQFSRLMTLGGHNAAV